MRRQERMKFLAGKLETLSPLRILSRGYSICWSLPSRHVLKAASEASVGAQVAVRLHQGELICEVRDIDSDDGG